MSIGVSYDEFWNGDYTQLKYALDAWNMRKKTRNEELWLQGLYIYDAVSVAIYNALKGKGQQAKEYIKEPIRITPMTEEEKESEANKTLEDFKAQLTALTGRLEQREKRRTEENEAKKNLG